MKIHGTLEIQFFPKLGLDIISWLLYRILNSRTTESLWLIHNWKSISRIVFLCKDFHYTETGSNSKLVMILKYVLHRLKATTSWAHWCLGMSFVDLPQLRPDLTAQPGDVFQCEVWTQAVWYNHFGLLRTMDSLWIMIES